MKPPKTYDGRSIDKNKFFKYSKQSLTYLKHLKPGSSSTGEDVLSRISTLITTLLTFLVYVSFPSPLVAGESSRKQSEPVVPPPAEELKVEEPGMQVIPVPADPELEEQIKEVQKALQTIYQQMVRRKEALKSAQDAPKKAALYEEFEQLRKDREDMEKLLHELIDEAKVSQRTAIDEALARARWFERQQDYYEKKEEIIRDRQR